MELNGEYGPGTNENPTLQWPEEMIEVRQLILSERKRLHPYAHDGQDYEEYRKEMAKLMEGLFIK